VGKKGRRRRRKSLDGSGSTWPHPANLRNSGEKEQAEEALSRLVLASQPGALSVAGAYALGYCELAFSQMEDREPRWYRDLDPLEIMFLGAVWPMRFSDSAHFTNACTDWLRLLRLTVYWTYVERLVHEAITLSGEHLLPLDDGEFLLMLTGRLEIAGLDHRKLPKRLLPQSLLRDSRAFSGPDLDLVLPEPPADADELVSRLKEPRAHTDSSAAATAADALRSGLRTLATTGMDFLDDSPEALLLALYAALVLDDAEDLPEVGTKPYAWALELESESPLVPVTDVILVAMNRELDADSTLRRLLAIPELTQPLIASDREWRSSPGNAFTEVAFQLGYHQLIFTGYKRVHLSPAGRAAIEAARRRFREKFGRLPGPTDPLFFDPDSDEPQMISVDDFDDPMIDMLEAAGISSAWLYAYERTGGLLPRYDGSFASEWDRSEWNKVIAEYRTEHDPGAKLDHEAETAKLRAILVYSSLSTMSIDPEHSVSVNSRLTDGRSVDDEIAVLQAYLRQNQDSYIQRLGANQEVLRKAQTYARMWAGPYLAAALREASAGNRKNLSDPALLAAALAAFECDHAAKPLDDDQVGLSAERPHLPHVPQNVNAGRDALVS